MILKTRENYSFSYNNIQSEIYQNNLSMLTIFPFRHVDFQFFVVVEDSFANISHQGSYGSRKTWKVMEFCFLAFQTWKVMEFCVELWKVMENLITIENYESIFIVYHYGQKFHWMYFYELQIISHRKDRKSHEKSHEKSWNFL